MIASTVHLTGIPMYDDSDRESNPTPRIVVVSASLAPRSRSRIVAQFAADYLSSKGLQTDFIDLSETPLLSYPMGKNDTVTLDLIERYNAAHGYILAFPIHNWSPSGQLSAFLGHVLDASRNRFRPYIAIAAASSNKSFLAFDALARTMACEVDAVAVGRANLAPSTDVDRDTGTISDALRSRMERSVDALIHFTHAAIALTPPALHP